MKGTTTLAAILLLQTLNAQDCVDVDGNVYGTVAIGSQLWSTGNLSTTHYRNGDAIPSGLSDGTWNTATTGAMCDYENTPSTDAAHGKLYNWYAATDPRGLCPAGWHLPSDEEWKTLELFLGMPASEVELTGTSRGADENIGGMLKDTIGFDAPNVGADNSTGFGGYPAGMRYQNSDWCCLNQLVVYWTSTPYDAVYAYTRNLAYDWTSVLRWSGDHKVRGFSARCVFDQPIGIVEPAANERVAISAMPNPTNGKVVVRIEEDVQACSASVRNSIGQIVLTTVLSANGVLALDLSPFESGVYSLEVFFANGTHAVQRIVKQ